MTPDEIRGNVRALLPSIAKRGDEIERLRRLPADLVEDLRGAGAFRIAAPQARGGPELRPREQVELIEELAVVEPSVAWCVMIGSDGPYASAFLAPAVVEELFPSIDMVLAGLAQPAGRAVVTDGGYTVSGRWAFGSGCTHADVLLGGCLVFDDASSPPRMRPDGQPEWRIAVAPREQWEILDTWYTTGLAGSGSNDYTVQDLFVPEAHTFTFYDAPRRPEALYAFAGTFVTNMSGVPLGIARRAIDVVVETAPGKLVMPEMQMMKDLRRVRSAVAHAEAVLGAARAYVYESLDRAWETLSSGEPLTVDERNALSLSRAHSFRVALDVTRSMVDAMGASAVYASSPLDRLHRDAITINQHIVTQERTYETLGGTLLGEPLLFPLY